MARPEFAAAAETAAKFRRELQKVFPGATEVQVERAALAAGAYAARLVEIHARPPAGQGSLLPEREAS